jgi:colanic acid/amylovoran biosynthesis glycosyltransferase
VSLSIAHRAGNAVADFNAGRNISTDCAQSCEKTAAPRLGYLISRYPSVSHTFILREVRQLRQSGFEICCASVNDPDRSVGEMTADEVEEASTTYYLKAHGIPGAVMAHLWGLLQPARYFMGLLQSLRFEGLNLKRGLYGIFYFTEALMLARWMSANRLTHLHVHFATAAANIALLLKHVSAAGVSMTIHGPDEFYDVSGQKLIEKVAASDFLVCIGRFARSQMMKLAPAAQWSKFEICPLGVDVDHYNPQPADRNGKPFTVLCVGRLTAAKGQHILIDACAVLRDWGRDFRLVVVGSGPDESSLRAAARRHRLEHLVEFTGALNQDQVRARYRDSDVFALPSFAEGIPVVLMEAMASGVPCVTTRITGIPELIRDGIDGLLVTPSDTQELADALAMLMDDPELREELGRAGRARVGAHYNLSQNVARLGAIFKTRLGSPS